jgi:dihydrofolate reductase
VRLRIEGFAIVSADGMIADSAGEIPPELVNPADQQFFSNRLDAADVVIHGRRSHEGHANAPRRRRLVLTRKVMALTPHPDYPRALLWNPDRDSLEAACAALGLEAGTAAVIGGTEAYGRFLPHYGAFHLSRAERISLAGGRPIFPGIPPQTAEGLLKRHGLVAGETRSLDAAAGVSVQSWQRADSAERLASLPHYSHL